MGIRKARRKHFFLIIEKVIKMMKRDQVLSGCLSIINVVFITYLINMRKKKKIYNLQHRIEVLSDHFQLLNHWMEIKSEGKSVASYFEDMGYHNIAVYGMAELANRLSDDLDGSSIFISYGIDRDICCTIARIDQIYFPEDELPEVDAVIVTPYSSFEEIQSMLKKKVTCPIVSLEEVIWSV